MRGPIQNIENIHIYKSITERFVEVFKEEVEKNPRATVDEVRKSILGLLRLKSNTMNC